MRLQFFHPIVMFCKSAVKILTDPVEAGGDQEKYEGGECHKESCAENPPEKISFDYGCSNPYGGRIYVVQQFRDYFGQFSQHLRS